MTSPAALFRKHPLDSTVEVDGESLPSPYHVYGGALACLSGTVAADVAADLLADDPFVPLSDATGRALSIVWVGDFTEASLGAHREVQISLLATPAPVPAVEANPLAVQRALFSVPGIVNVCHGLWNDTSRVVSFNREHLHLDAAEASIDITRGTDAWTFAAADVTSTPVVSGQFAAPGRPAGALGRSLVTLLGPKATVRILSSRTAKAKVANTTRPGVQGGRLAQTYTQGARQGLRPADTADQVVLLHPRYADLGFSLGSVQVIDGLRFVYERPVAPIVIA